jgi:glycosyltransferase involved in cell wall biosynthesis
MSITKKSFAILHAFFVPKGGGEKLIFDIRNHYHADLFTGAIDFNVWNPENTKKDSFVRELFDPKYKFTWLHKDSKIPFWRKIKRQFYLKFDKKLKNLNNYDFVLFSGNVAGVADRIRNSKTKKIVYCHTPPRPFTDQFEKNLAKFPIFLHPVVKMFRDWVLLEYKNELSKMDIIITNSFNIQKRLKTFVGLDSKVIQPAVNIDRFRWIEQGDYFISYARLEDLKRIKLIVEAFKLTPQKKIIICSTGPLSGWVREQSNAYTNIEFRGLVTDSELENLVGRCRAGIYIPEEEDFGIIQCELMAAGKPVIGVKEGGLLETVIDGKTGILLPSNPSKKDLICAVDKLSPKLAMSMKLDCINQSKLFSPEVFFEKLNRELTFLK